MILDLEDGVAPGAKDAAVGYAAALLRGHTEVPCWVRLDTDRWESDLTHLVGPGLCGLIVPKAESRVLLARVAGALDDLEVAASLPPGQVRLGPIVESAAGVANLAGIAAAPRVLRLGMGEADLAAALGTRKRPDGLELLYVRSQVVVTSAAAGIAPPVASTSTDWRDLDALRHSTALLRDLGFTARTAVHPAQLPVIAAGLAPTDEELVWASKVLAAFAAGVQDSQGSVAVGGTLVDLAVVRAARLLIGDLPGQPPASQGTEADSSSPRS